MRKKNIQEKTVRTIIISTFFLRMIIIIAFYLIKNYLYFLSYLNVYFFDLLAHHLSKIKYQTEFAIGSTIASVNATAKDTSATSIKTEIAIIKCPIV